MAPTSFLIESAGSTVDRIASSLENLFGEVTSGGPDPHHTHTNSNHSHINFQPKIPSHPSHPTAFVRDQFILSEPANSSATPAAIELGQANRQAQWQPPPAATQEVSRPLTFPEHSNINNENPDAPPPPKPGGLKKGTVYPRRPLSNPAFQSLPKAPEQSLNLIRWHQNTTSQACDPLVLWKIRQGLIALKWHILAMQDHSSPPTGLGNRWKSQDFVDWLTKAEQDLMTWQYSYHPYPFPKCARDGYWNHLQQSLRDLQALWHSRLPRIQVSKDDDINEDLKAKNKEYTALNPTGEDVEYVSIEDRMQIDKYFNYCTKLIKNVPRYGELIPSTEVEKKAFLDSVNKAKFL